MKRVDAIVNKVFINSWERLTTSSTFLWKLKARDFILKYVYRAFGRHINHKWNYDFCADSFNRSYYWKNYLKSMIFINNILDSDLKQCMEIIDIGCGAAPASAAFGTLFRERKQVEIKVNLIDKSVRQIKLAQQFLTILQIDINSINTEVFQLNGKTFEHIVLFSFFICEQNNQFIEELFLQRECFKAGFIVIDYNLTIKLLQDMFAKNGDKRLKVKQYKYLLNAQTRSVLNEEKDEEIWVNGCIFVP